MSGSTQPQIFLTKEEVSDINVRIPGGNLQTVGDLIDILSKMPRNIKLVKWDGHEEKYDTFYTTQFQWATDRTYKQLFEKGVMVKETELKDDPLDFHLGGEELCTVLMLN